MYCIFFWNSSGILWSIFPRNICAIKLIISTNIISQDPSYNFNKKFYKKFLHVWINSIMPLNFSEFPLCVLLLFGKYLGSSKLDESFANNLSFELIQWNKMTNNLNVESGIYRMKIIWINKYKIQNEITNYFIWRSNN